jgi:hypothetical protein
MYFLVVAVIAVVIVGRLLAYSGKRYLAGPTSGSSQAGSVAALVAVLFHLVTLGLTALFAAIPFGGSPTQVFLIRIGLVLILIGTAYAVALRMLTRRKEEAVVTEYDAQVREMRHERQAANEYEVTNDPSAGMAPQPVREPTLGEPTLGERRRRA